MKARDLLAAAALVMACMVATPAHSQQRMQDIHEAVEGLLRTKAKDAYLVIEVVGTEDFVQLGAHGEPVILDFPQITPRQKEFRQQIESVCADLGLELKIVLGGDGADFLNYELEQDATEIAAIVEAVLRRVYGVDASTPLYFEAYGFELAPPQPLDELQTRVTREAEGIAHPYETPVSAGFASAPS